jgi:hypothetical protein
MFLVYDTVFKLRQYSRETFDKWLDTQGMRLGAGAMWPRGRRMVGVCSETSEVSEQSLDETA